VIVALSSLVRRQLTVLVRRPLTVLVRLRLACQMNCRAGSHGCGKKESLHAIGKCADAVQLPLSWGSSSHRVGHSFGRARGFLALAIRVLRL